MPGSAPDLDSILAGAAVLDLAAEHRDPAVPVPNPAAGLLSAGKALELGVSGGNDAFIEALAERIAVGATAVAAVLDPTLIVLRHGRAGRRRAPARGTRWRPPSGPPRRSMPRSPRPGSPTMPPLGAIDASLEAVREVLIQAAHHMNTGDLNS